MTHTPGPWGWFGNENNVYLATVGNGRRFVMNFARRGLQGAQPCFMVNGIMEPGIDLARFVVDRTGAIRGLDEARQAPAVYRYDIADIDHPDARLIKAAPMLFQALIDLVKANEDWNAAVSKVVTTPPNWSDAYLDQARAAIREVRGEA